MSKYIYLFKSLQMYTDKCFNNRSETTTITIAKQGPMNSI